MIFFRLDEYINLANAVKLPLCYKKYMGEEIKIVDDNELNYAENMIRLMEYGLC